MKRFLLVLLTTVSAASAIGVGAQNTVQGTVVEASAGNAIQGAIIQILSGYANVFAGYGVTGENGTFSIKCNRTDSLRIVVSFIGYKKIEQSIRVGETLIIQLEEEAFALEEVTVRPGRVWSRKDTINYDINRFLTSKDKTIRDVLEKLPGIDVDEKGKISYLGKDISNFYVEGMDPVGGRYNQITNNLRAEAVQTVQVMENHQPVKMLEDLVLSEDVALNLKLKAEFQAVWMFTLEGALGVSSRLSKTMDDTPEAASLLWKTMDNAIRLSKTNQSIFSYKSNNTGNDYTMEQGMLAFRRNSFMDAPSELTFLSMPSITAPLKKERLLFNNVHSFTANRMNKLNETTKMRINANYTHDERKQERGSETIYYFTDDTARISETSSAKLYADEASLGIHIENNASDKYLTNSFNISAKQNKGISDFSGADLLTATQRLQTSTVGANNDFRTLWGKQAYRYEIRSLLRYDYLPEELRTDNIEQKTQLSRFYTDNAFSITGQKSNFVPQYTIGFTGDFNNIQNGITPYIAPNLQWNKGKWQTRFALPVLWANYLGANFSRLSARPSANISCKFNYAWRLMLSAAYREQFGDLLNFYAEPYYTDYRRITYTPDQLPIQQMQNYSVYGEYKKTASEFFTSLTLSYMDSKNSHVYEQTSDDGYITMMPTKMSNHATTQRIAGTLSKGFYDIKLAASLSAQYSQSTGEQFSNNARLPYLSSRTMLEPKLNWTYWKNLDISYLATINQTGSKVGDHELNPLWTVLQKLQLTCLLSSIEATLSADHYYNEVNNADPVRNYFIDLAFRYKHKKWQFTAGVNNLLDTRKYGYSEYSAIRSYSSWIHIRGREFLAGAQYKF